MPVNVGQAVGYLDLDTTKFKAGFKSALADLKVFQQKTATSRDKLMAFSSAATSTGRSLTKGLTAPLAGIGVASVAVAAGFDKGMSQVKAISGATGKEFGQLREKAIEMGAKTKFSASESAEAFKYMGMAGWKTADMLQGIDGVMNLAAASGEELGTVSDIVTDSLTAFGLSAKDSAHFADVLAAAATNSNTNVGMLGDSFKYVAPVAGALGYKVEDVTTALGIMANSGIKGSQAGTSLRRMFTSLAKPTGEAKKAFQDLGLKVADSNGKMKPLNQVVAQLREGFAGLTQKQRAQYAATIAGQEGMSGLLAIVNTSEKDYKKFAGALDDADGSAEKMANTMLDNLPGSLTLAKSALEGLGIRIGSVMTPALKKLVDGFTKFISWLSQASDGTIKFAVALGTVLASIGPLLLITGHLAGAIVNLTNAYEVLNKVALGQTIKKFASMAAAKLADAAATTVDTITQMRYRIATSGIGQAVGRATSGILAMAAAHKVAAAAALGVVGVVAGLLIYMYKTGTSFSELKDKVTNFITSALEKFFQIMPEVVSTLGQLATSVGETLKKVIPQFLKWWAKDMPKLIEAGADIVVNLINGFAESAPQLIAAGSEALISMIEGFTQSFPVMVQAGTSMITAMIQGISEALPGVVSAIVNILSDNLGTIIDSVVTAVESIISAISQNAPQIIDAGLKLMMALLTGIVKALPQIIQGVIRIGFALTKALIALIPALLQAAIQLFMALVKAIPVIVGALVRALPQIVNAFKQGLINTLPKLWDQMKKGFLSAITSMVLGAKTKVSKLKDWVLSPIKKIAKTINNLKIKLPLKIPVVKLSGGKAPWGIAGKGKLPSFHVKWNRIGAIFTEPTIFGAIGNTLLGAGEAGAEALIPLSQLWKRFDAMLELLRQLVVAVQSTLVGGVSGVDYAYAGANSVGNSVADLRTAVAELSALVTGYSETNNQLIEAMRNMTIESNLILDKKVAATALSQPMREALNTLDSRNNRKRGKA